MEKTNFCKMGDCMSKCTLTEIKEQYKCLFFIKASESAIDPNRCRYYRPELDNHCDNPAAQADSVNVVVKEKEPDTESAADFSY